MATAVTDAQGVAQTCKRDQGNLAVRGDSEDEYSEGRRAYFISARYIGV